MADQQHQKFQSQATPSLYEPPVAEDDTARQRRAGPRPASVQRYEVERIRRLRRLDQVLLGAMLATFVGALGVLIYLLTSSYSSAYVYLLPGSPLINYVTTYEYGDAFDTSEVLTVMVARFLLGFGLTWAPLTMVVAFLDWLGRQFRSNG